MLEHGAALFLGVVDEDAAESFRNYALRRNTCLRKDDLVFVMNTYTKRRKRQTR